MRDLIKQRRDSEIMLMRRDSTRIPGIFSIDGYVDIANRSASQIADLILSRVSQTK